MDWFSLLGVAIGLLKGVLAAATTSKLPQEILDAIQSSITALQGVHGSPVTKAQLEQLRVDAPFGG
jgi:hypothetical protein